jgi:hypothetical protein
MDEYDSDETEGFLDLDDSMIESFVTKVSPVSYSSANYWKGYKGQLIRTRVGSKSKMTNLEKFCKILGSDVEGLMMISKYRHFNAGMSYSHIFSVLTNVSYK